VRDSAAASAAARRPRAAAKRMPRALCRDASSGSRCERSASAATSLGSRGASTPSAPQAASQAVGCDGSSAATTAGRAAGSPTRAIAFKAATRTPASGPDTARDSAASPKRPRWPPGRRQRVRPRRRPGRRAWRRGRAPPRVSDLPERRAAPSRTDGDTSSSAATSSSTASGERSSARRPIASSRAEAAAGRDSWRSFRNEVTGRALVNCSMTYRVERASASATRVSSSSADRRTTPVRKNRIL
jgi:hypothetical protein